ncbi:MAG: hypothetical protein ABIH21_01305 [Patescibacteria group bacterium]
MLIQLLSPAFVLADEDDPQKAIFIWKDIARSIQHKEGTANRSYLAWETASQRTIVTFNSACDTKQKGSIVTSVQNKAVESLIESTTRELCEGSRFVNVMYHGSGSFTCVEHDYGAQKNRIITEEAELDWVDWKESGTVIHDDHIARLGEITSWTTSHGRSNELGQTYIFHSTTGRTEHIPAHAALGHLRTNNRLFFWNRDKGTGQLFELTPDGSSGLNRFFDGDPTIVVDCGAFLAVLVVDSKTSDEYTRAQSIHVFDAQTYKEIYCLTFRLHKDPKIGWTIRSSTAEPKSTQYPGNGYSLFDIRSMHGGVVAYILGSASYMLWFSADKTSWRVFPLPTQDRIRNLSQSPYYSLTEVTLPDGRCVAATWRHRAGVLEILHYPMP